MDITTGTSNTAVTELILTSVGANTVLAMQSQTRVIRAPVRKQPGIIMSGEVVRVMRLTRCGTAMPTKDIGPANAVTVAASRLDNRISMIRRSLIFTPILRA